jgi:D-glycero-alpha-D-manno-heptose 1-phosphate guanylyltransferase
MNKDLSVEALILTGGFGTRLRSVVSDRPKVIAEVAGKPFIAYLFDQLISAKFKKVVLCTGYKAEQIEGAFGNNYNGLEVAYSFESEPLGTGGGLGLALPKISQNNLLVMNGDSYCDENLGRFLDSHEQRNADTSMLLIKQQDTTRFGRVQLDENKRVVAFEEKGKSSGAGWINGGIYLMKKSLIEGFPKGQALSLEKDVFPKLCGTKFYGFESTAEFLDIGTPESYREAESFFARLKAQ